MKTKLIAFIAIFLLYPFQSFTQVPDSNATVKQWLDYIYAQLDTSSYNSTGILMDRGFMDTSFLYYRGAEEDSLGDKTQWYEMYNSVRLAGLDTMPPVDSVYKWAGAYIDLGITPIMGMHFRYNYLHPHALDSGWVDTINTQYVVQHGHNPFIEENLISFAPAMSVHYGDTFRFIFPSNLFFTNIQEQLQSVEYKVNDTEWQQAAFDTELTLSPSDFETEQQMENLHLKVKLIYLGYTWVVSYKTIIVKRDGDPYLFDAEINIQADNAIVGGAPAKGYAAITFGKDGSGNKQTCFTKPLIIVEGIDFGTPENPVGCRNGKCGTLGWEDIVTGKNTEWPQLANGPKMIEALTNLGYDLIYLDFHDGATWMEDNAMVLVKLIQHINQYKCTNEEIVVCGVSMGGQVAKYALSYMEINEINHCVRTYVSFDSPHKGANIPIGLQQFVQYAMIETKNADATWSYQGKFLRPASKQLLLQHITGPWAGAHNERMNFLTRLEAVDNYPKKTRNVAIINGSALAQGMAFNPGDRIFEWHWKTGIANIDVDIYATCGLGINWGAFTEYYTCVVDFPRAKARRIGAPNSCLTLDHAPGATRNDFNDLSGPHYRSGIRVGFGKSHFDYQCFIPSISALDVNTNDYFFDIETNIIDDKPNPTLYPFEAYYAPDINEEHVFLDYNETYPTDSELSNIAWFVNEVESTRVGLPGGNFSGTYNFGEQNKNRLPGISIVSGGIIQINGNYPTATGTGETPVEGTQFTVYKRGCDNTVKIKSGGSLVLGADNAPDNNTAIVYFTKGSRLEIESGGVLRIHDGSKLIIEEDATIVFHPDAIIYLEGENAVLEIRGKLQLESGAVFTFTKGAAAIGGYIRFDLSHPSSDISVNGNACKMVFTGNTHAGYSDKVLEIVGGTFRTPDVTQSSTNYLSEFSITTGTITIGANSKLHVSVNSNFNNCIFSGLSLSNSTGLFLPQPDLTTIEGCSFRNLALGLELNLSGINPNYEIELCSFRDNEVGIFSQNGGLNIYNCIFENNSNGWMAFTMNASTVYESSFQSNEYGIYAEGSSSPFLFIEKTDFVNNDFGAYVSSSELTLECCYFGNNNNRGVFANGLLNLSTLKTVNGKTGGNNAFYNNQIAVQIDGEIYLDEGQNLFRNNGGFSTNTFLTGNLPACNPCSFMSSSWQVYTAENYWDPGYQSSLQVQTFPHPSPASFTGTPHSSFTSSCFYEGFSGMPIFNSVRIAPSLKNELNEEEQPAESKVNNTNLVLYPNPAGQLVYLKGELKEATLYDMTGRNLGAFTQKNDEIWELNLLGIPPGIYLVTVQMSHRHENIKLIISH